MRDGRGTNGASGHSDPRKRRPLEAVSRHNGRFEAKSRFTVPASQPGSAADARSSTADKLRCAPTPGRPTRDVGGTRGCMLVLTLKSRPASRPWLTPGWGFRGCYDQERDQHTSRPVRHRMGPRCGEEHGRPVTELRGSRVSAEPALLPRRPDSCGNEPVAAGRRFGGPPGSSLANV